MDKSLKVRIYVKRKENGKLRKHEKATLYQLVIAVNFTRVAPILDQFAVFFTVFFLMCLVAFGAVMRAC